jgi:hypothetical protein
VLVVVVGWREIGSNFFPSMLRYTFHLSTRGLSIGSQASVTSPMPVTVAFRPVGLPPVAGLRSSRGLSNCRSTQLAKATAIDSIMRAIKAILLFMAFTSFASLGYDTSPPTLYLPYFLQDAMI